MSDDAKNGLPALAYRDLAAPAAQRLGEAIGRAVGLALAPVNGVLWTLEQAQNWLMREVQARFVARGVPPEAVAPPPPFLLGATVLGAQAAAGEPTLGALFAELLATAMQRDHAGEAHAAFVDVIRQLAPDDAALFVHVRGRVQQRGGATERYPNAPHWRERPRLVVRDEVELAREAGLPHPDRGPLALDNLKRVGLLGDLVTDATGARILAGPTLGVVLTPFGEAFARACLPASAPADRV